MFDPQHIYYIRLDILPSDVESLKKGTVKVSKKNGNAPCTIILVGESGVGKSSFVEFIANVLLGNGISHCKFDILDSTNEQGSSGRQSQTGSVYLYEFVSQNGIMVSASGFNPSDYA